MNFSSWKLNRNLNHALIWHCVAFLGMSTQVLTTRESFPQNLRCQKVVSGPSIWTFFFSHRSRLGIQTCPKNMEYGYLTFSNKLRKDFTNFVCFFQSGVFSARNIKTKIFVRKLIFCCFSKIP